MYNLKHKTFFFRNIFFFLEYKYYIHTHDMYVCVSLFYEIFVGFLIYVLAPSLMWPSYFIWMSIFVPTSFIISNNIFSLFVWHCFYLNNRVHLCIFPELYIIYNYYITNNFIPVKIRFTEYELYPLGKKSLFIISFT